MNAEAPYYDPFTGRCPHGVRAPHECRSGCEARCHVTILPESPAGEMAVCGDPDTDPLGVVYYDDAPAPVALDDEERLRQDEWERSMGR